MHSKLDLTVIHSPVLRPEDWLRFVELEPFPRQWKSLNLTDDDLSALQTIIVVDPNIGSVVKGSGGLRKVRFSTPGSHAGKRGAYRVFYCHFPDYGLAILWAILAKGEKDDLTKAELNAFAAMILRLQGLLDQGVIR